MKLVGQRQASFAAEAFHVLVLEVEIESIE
jgi:hypothetical protein